MCRNPERGDAEHGDGATRGHGDVETKVAVLILQNKQLQFNLLHA
jgi:hypothetical protein